MAEQQHRDEILWGWEQIAEALGVSAPTARQYAELSEPDDIPEMPLMHWPETGKVCVRRGKLLDWVDELCRR